MKKFLLLAFLVFITGYAHAQALVTGNLTIAGTAPACVSKACVHLAVSPEFGGATFTLNGTWSGTVTFYGSGDGGVTLVALNATPSNGSTATSTATANGTWQTSLSGYTDVYLIFTTASSGTVVATINPSHIAAGRGGGPGGGGSISACTASGGIAFENGTNNTLTCVAAFTYSQAAAHFSLSTSASSGSAFGERITSTSTGTTGLSNLSIVGTQTGAGNQNIGLNVSITNDASATFGPIPAVFSAHCFAAGCGDATYGQYFDGNTGVTITGVQAGTVQGAVIGSAGNTNLTLSTITGYLENTPTFVSFTGGTLSNYWGFGVTSGNGGVGPATGTFHTNIGYYADPMVGGDTLNAAFYSADQGAGSTNYSFYSAGGKNHFVGTLEMGNVITFLGSGSGSASTGVAAAAGSPCTLIFPITSPSAGQVLSAAAPSGGNCQESWATVASATPSFSTLSSGTNTTASMLVGTGASLGVTGSGTINATTLGGATFAAPGAIGGGTPSTAAFTVVGIVGGTNSAPSIGLTAFPTYGLGVTSSGLGFFTYNSAYTMGVSGNGAMIPTADVYAFSSTSDPVGGTADTAISRVSAGVVGASTGAGGSAAGQFSAASYIASSTTGISSSGHLCSATFTSVGGIVTACTAVSDPRVKVFGSYTPGLDTIMKIKPIHFHYNEAGLMLAGLTSHSNTEQIGFSAKNIQQAMPEAVGTEYFNGVDYLTLPQGDRPIVAALVNAVKEQQKEIDELKKQIKMSK